jgi:hypothetical protein
MPEELDSKAGEQKEPNIRVNMKQTAKGEWYSDVTVRGDDIDEVKKRLVEATDLAIKRAGELNAA